VSKTEDVSPPQHIRQAKRITKASIKVISQADSSYEFNTWITSTLTDIILLQDTANFKE